MARKIILTLTLGWAFAACQTIPDNAPQEIREARDSFSQAQSEDVDDLFPVTMEKAEYLLEDSLALLNESDDEADEGRTDLADAARASAIDKARQSLQLTMSARQANQQVMAWNEDIEGFQRLQLAAQESEGLQQELDALRTTNQDLESQNVGLQAMTEELKNSVRVIRAIPEDFRVAKPVAYFETDSTEIREANTEDVSELADVLKGHPELSVKLAGYADPRGPAEYNDKLSKERAEAVKDKLVEDGVDPKKIEITAMGETDTKSMEAAGLQLDRKVIANLTVSGRNVSEVQKEAEQVAPGSVTGEPSAIPGEPADQEIEAE